MSPCRQGSWPNGPRQGGSDRRRVEHGDAPPATGLCGIRQGGDGHRRRAHATGSVERRSIWRFRWANTAAAAAFRHPAARFDALRSLVADYAQWRNRIRPVRRYAGPPTGRFSRSVPANPIRTGRSGVEGDDARRCALLHELFSRRKSPSQHRLPADRGCEAAPTGLSAIRIAAKASTPGVRSPAFAQGAR